MSLFADGGPKTLEQVLGDQANGQVQGIQDAYAQKRKRLVASEAHNGRLMSGVSDYPLGGLASDEGSAIGGVESGLASALGGIPANDYLDQYGYNQNLDLTKLIGQLNRPSDLQEALGLLGQTGRIAGTVAAFS